MANKKANDENGLHWTTTNLEGSGITNNNQQESTQQLKPLELLIVSDEEPYREAGKKYYSPLVTPEGSTLFDVTAATKGELAESLEHKTGSNGNIVFTYLQRYFADVLLFDLRGDLNGGLELLDNYLSMHQGCFTIASVEESSLDSLLTHPTWHNLQREVGETVLSLTQRYRFPKTIIRGPDYKNYFDRIHKEPLNATNLSIIRNLKDGHYDIIKRITPHPTEFGEFSKEIREKYGLSELVVRSLDRIVGFNPDETLNILEEIQPPIKHSVPQHCYPPFEDLVELSPKEVTEEIIPIIKNQGSKPLSLYVDIPFCPGKNPCKYCDYTTVRGAGGAQRYLELLRKEAQKIYDLTGWSALSPKGIHIGGGTPSMLSPELIRELGNFLKNFFPNYQENTQLTFEVSPQTTIPEKLDAFKDIGATRASVGLQSISDERLLRWLNRIYSLDKGQKAIELLLERWPNNTNIDILYGLPGQTLESWERDLDGALQLDVPSITFYDLRISPRTRFPEGQKFPTLYETMLMRIMAIEKFKEVGYIQSNDNQFVKSTEKQQYVYKEFKKRGGNTLGIGLSSYSIFPGIIYFNVGGRDPYDEEQNMENYSKAIEEGRLPIEIGKILDKREQMKLYMVQGLKLSGIDKDANGVDITQFEKRFGQSVSSVFRRTQSLTEKGLLEIKGNFLGLTYKGLAFEPLVLKTFYQ